jgi:hypothetical protein
VDLLVANLRNPQHAAHPGAFQTLALFDPTDLLGIFVQASRQVLDREAASLAHLHEEEACSLDTTRFLEIGDLARILQEVRRGERVESIPIKRHHTRP